MGNMPYPKVEYTYMDTQTNAMEFVFRKWVTETNDFSMLYSKKVNLTALAKIFTTGDSRLDAITTQGYPIINKKAGRFSRSQTRFTNKIPLQFTQMPLSTKILSILLIEWEDDLMRKNQNKDKKNKDTSPFVPIIDDGEYLTLDTYCDEYSDYEEVLKETHPESAEDPLNDIDLEQFISDFIKQCAASNANRLLALTKHLNKKDKKLLERLIGSAPTC